MVYVKYYMVNETDNKEVIGLKKLPDKDKNNIDDIIQKEFDSFKGDTNSKYTYFIYAILTREQYYSHANFLGVCA